MALVLISLACLCGMLFFVGFFVAVIYIIYRSRQEQSKAWRHVAARTGLTFEPGVLLGSPRVTGNYRGRALRLDAFARRYGASDVTRYTRIVLAVNNRAGVVLTLRREGVLSPIAKALGAEDIRLGDEEVDRRFLIQSRPATFAAELFTSRELRQRLLQIRALHLVAVNGTELRFEQVEVGIEKDVDYLLSLFDLLSDLAEQLEHEPGRSNL